MITSMKTTEYIRNGIDRMPRGQVFRFAELVDDVARTGAVIKFLNRLVGAGRLEKLSKGRFYKPQEGVFGRSVPDQYQVVKDLLEKNGRIIGYLTGYSVYGKLGLTTQVSNSIQIGRNDIRSLFRRGIYTISFVRQKNAITKEVIPLLQILDAIRLIKKIPDAGIVSVCRRLLAIVQELRPQDLVSIADLALRYPPATRALLGAILDQLGNTSISQALRSSLNPVSTYCIPGCDTVMSTASIWNIV